MYRNLLQLMAANKQNEKMVIDDSTEGRSKNKFNSKNNDGKDTSPVMDRSFGFKFLGFNALANYLINSVSYTTTQSTCKNTGQNYCAEEERKLMAIAVTTVVGRISAPIPGTPWNLRLF